jgi:type I restriction enzyme S subunit
MTWPIVRLEELAAPEPNAIKIGPFGSQLKREELVDEGVHVVGIENVLAGKFDGLGQRFVTSERYRALRSVEVRPGDVVVTMMGTIGEVAVVPPGTSLSIMDSHLLRFRPNVELCLPEFIAWFLRGPSARAAVNNRAHGAIMKGLNSAIVRSLPIPLPSVSEQRRIVKILDEADHLRRLRAEADAKADRIVPALFIKMFGEPETNPMGWPVRTLGELATLGPEYGANARAVQRSPGQPRYVRITDIDDDGRLRALDAVGIDLDEWEQYKLEDGDVLFARSGATVGKSYLHRAAYGLCVFAGYLIRFRLDPAKLHPVVAFGFTQTAAYRAWVAAKRRIAAQPNINGQEYASLRLPVPARAAQERFVSAYSRLDDVRRARSCSSNMLEALFSTLLHRAFEGILTAVWREAHMNELLQEMDRQAKLLDSLSTAGIDAHEPRSHRAFPLDQDARHDPGFVLRSHRREQLWKVQHSSGAQPGARRDVAH